MKKQAVKFKMDEQVLLKAKVIGKSTDGQLMLGVYDPSTQRWTDIWVPPSVVMKRGKRI